MEDFLQSCRQARNAYAHVAFDGYAGAVTLPPPPVVERLERIVASFRNPVKVTSVAVAAQTCDPATPLQHALRLMRQGDFSQLPYCHPDRGWLLVTRDQLARWLQVHADDSGLALVDLTQPVATLADDPRVGPVQPRRVPPATLLAEAIDQLEEALHLPDHEPGGYPFLLVDAAGSRTPPKVVSVDDLPQAYDLLGR
jgi:hypothetical protein